MLRGLRLDGVDYSRCRMAEPWALAFPAEQAARLLFVSNQGCWLRYGDGQWLEMKAGDAVLLPHGGAHVLASDRSLAPTPQGACARAPICENLFAVDGGGAGEVCVLFWGSLHFNIDPMHPLIQLMPDVMQACNLEQHEPAIPHLIEAMARETALDRVGAAGILARLADVHAQVLLMELRDLAAVHGDRPTGPVARLAAYDGEHDSNLVATLRAWLDAFGDVAAASAAMYVHPNTFRYRLRRVTEVSGIDLADPEQRFATMLELRVVRPATHPPR